MIVAPGEGPVIFIVEVPPTPLAPTPLPEVIYAAVDARADVLLIPGVLGIGFLRRVATSSSSLLLSSSFPKFTESAKRTEGLVVGLAVPPATPPTVLLRGVGPARAGVKCGGPGVPTAAIAVTMPAAIIDGPGLTPPYWA